MGWPTTLVKTPEEMFKQASSVAQHKTGLKVLIYGKEDTMKTGFALSFPPPIYIFDTELGAPPLFQYFKGKDIRWCDATFLSPTGLHDASVALQSLESGIALLRDVKQGTIVIDSGTDVTQECCCWTLLLSQLWHPKPRIKWGASMGLGARVVKRSRQKERGHVTKI